MPGLVNAHTHSPMVLFRGLAEGHSLLTFEGWFQAIRSWEFVLEPEWIAPAVTVSCAEMIRTGTTCFADQYFHMDRILPAVRASGLRAALAYGIVELGDPAAREPELSAAQAFLESVAGDARLAGWIGPHAFFVDNGPETIAAELDLADRYETGLHIHLATSGEEDRYCLQHFGHSAVAEMERLGVLRRRVLAAHCLTIPEADLPTLASNPFTAVLCPSACMRSGAAAPPLTELRSAGVHLALGSDNVANNNSYDLFEEMRTLAKLAAFSQRRPAALPAEDVLRMATLGGAAALGLEDQIGSLEPGKSADLIALDLTQIGWAPTASQDPYSALVYSAGGMHVTDVMVAGRWLYRQGTWTTVDYPAAVAELEQAHAHLLRARAAVQEQP
jgi:5-methylthioadenosine/S-adenosylhomocysteine deaminase